MSPTLCRPMSHNKRTHFYYLFPRVRVRGPQQQRERGPDNILAEEERRPPGRFATSRYSPTLMPTHTPASNKQRSDTKAPPCCELFSRSWGGCVSWKAGPGASSQKRWSFSRSFVSSELVMTGKYISLYRIHLCVLLSNEYDQISVRGLSRY